MSTSEDYPDVSVRSKVKETPDWLSRLKTNKYLLAGFAVALFLIVFLMIRHRWFLWLYVVLSMLFLVGIGIYVLLFKKRVAGREGELETGINDLRIQNDSLKNQIIELEENVSNKDFELEQLKLQLDNVENDYKLENKYLYIFSFIQFLDRSVDDLPECTNDFKTSIHKRLQVLLASYGYKFLDYEPQYSELFDYEYDHAIEVPEIVRRTIVDKNGNIALKGKVYINKDYEARR